MKLIPLGNGKKAIIDKKIMNGYLNINGRDHAEKTIIMHGAVNVQRMAN